ncbi:DUF2971 domain-containing protein [Ruegeria sp. WL0004]|uniref:DUF2971 domain-containing protein n=1 Tax=Ruegeria marisflavi TaxID=2984152 RepID=A0ABT2WSP5_9RHOB|nr:DUF2971 domain-containing protein [Ruegeria sp. WL0004]
MFYFTSPNHLLENLTENQIKLSDFKKCNDVFELASFALKDKKMRENHRAWIEELSSELGLICFSQDWRNPLMWGHYSKSGEGVCLVLDVAVSQLQPVEYLLKRATSDASCFPRSGDPMFKKFCAQKSHHWRYEKEERLFVTLHSNKVIHQDNGKKFLKMGGEVQLVGFINGPRPELSADEIKSAFGGKRPLKHFQCRAAFRDFRMVVQQDTSLWKGCVT